MKKKLVIFFSLLFFTTFLNAGENKIVQQKDFENSIISIDLDGYKILQFSKQIKKVHFDNSDYVEADFLNNSQSDQLTTLKVKAKKIGKQNAIVTFYDKSIVTVGFTIVKNINNIIELVNKLYPNITVSQINDNIILEGHVKNQTQKAKLIEIFEKSGIDVDAHIIDLIKDNYSTKMIRVKLYVVQIDNNKGVRFLNDWSFSDFDDGKTSLDGTIKPSFNDITSITGGITAAAARLGSNFNVGLTINYLKKNNAVRLVNESTLIMKENKEAKFNTGGKFFIQTSTTTAEGVPSSELTEVEYGLNIHMKAKKIIENKYIDFEAMAKSDAVDDNTTVDGVPGLIGNEVTTNVLIENGATIVLAGILSSDYGKLEEKVPFLGDIPYLGKLFTSSDTNNENRDLVFFLTPEIIDPMNHNQDKLLKEKLSIVEEKDYRNKKEIEEDLKIPKEEQVTLFDNLFENSNKKTEPKLTDEELHQKRVNQLLGYE